MVRTTLNGWRNMVIRDCGVRDMVRNWFASTAICAAGFACLVDIGAVNAQPSNAPPVVEKSPLLREPSTPEELFASTLLMVDLVRPDLAARYLEQFEAAAPDDDVLIKVRDRFGTGDFLKLARVKELQPRSTELLHRLTEIAKKQAADPAFVDGLLNRIINDPADRERAMIELRNAGTAAVPEVLKKMTQPEMEQHQDLIVIALYKMGNQVIPPLIGAIDTPHEPLRAAVIDVLGWLDARVAVPYLWFPAFDENQGTGVRAAARRALAKLLKGSSERIDRVSSVEAASELRRLAKLHYRMRDAEAVNDEGRVVLWSWDGEQGTVIEQAMTPEIASLLISSRFAGQALSLSPDQPEPQRQYLASLLGLEVARFGWDHPRIATPQSAMYLAMTSGESTVAHVLAEALEAGQATTAVAALEVLGQIGSREQLQSQKGMKSPLIAALGSPDARVQFAAAITILKLDPQTPFSRSNRVVEILSRTLTDPGVPRVVVIDADGTRSTVTSGFLAEGGYESVTARTGRDGFEQAANSAGVQLIVVDANCVRWDLTPTLTNLRADSRTAAIPIVVYGPTAVGKDVARLIARNAPAVFVAESASAGDFLGQLDPFIKTVKTVPLSDQERGQEKAAAVYWLSAIGAGNLAKIFDITKAENNLSLAIDDPAVVMNALSALGTIGTKTSQQRLFSVAVNPQATENVREHAANQLAFHIQRYSLQLSPDDVTQLQDSWNKTDNPRVKAALAGVIGSLHPNPAVVGRRLQEFKSPTTK